LGRLDGTPGNAWSDLLDRYKRLTPQQQRILVVYLLAATTDAALTSSRIDDYERAHIGTYASWQDARDDLVEFLGWPDVLAQADVRDDFGESIEDLLTWDETAVRERLNELYFVAELDDDTVYLFHRGI
jgi:hypothetical protein